MATTARQRIAWNRKILNEPQIISGYQTGLSSYKLAKEFNVHYSTILEVLKRNGIQRKGFSDYRKYAINENYFENIDSYEKAYILGFVIADGCISYRKWQNVLKISISNKDYDHLVKIRDLMAPNTPIIVRPAPRPFNPSYIEARLSISSYKLADHLKYYGVIPRKSDCIQWSNIRIPNEFMGSCLLGIFDGDGSWIKSKNMIMFSLCSGNKIFLEQLQEYLIQNLGLPKLVISESYNVDTNSSRWYLRYSAEKNCKLLYEFM
ncbi:MAG TPA: hypothetical protein VKR58_06515, partial [Aquella sp.]|nr:hypothetical protein [Aquella sp.]